MIAFISMTSAFMHARTFLAVLAFAYFFGNVAPALAQETHLYTVKSNQAPKLQADAGGDIEAMSGNVISLGGDPVAMGGTPPYAFAWTPVEELSGPEDSHPQITVGETPATYVLTVTDDAGCTASDEIIVSARIITSTISRHDGKFHVFPNPSNTWLVVRVAGIERGTMAVVDGSGADAMTEELHSGENLFDISSLKSGVYFLRLNEGLAVQTIRIVVP